MFGPKASRSNQLLINEDCESAFNAALSAVEAGGFSNIRSNKSGKVINADYHKFSVWGKIEISVLQESTGSRINVKSFAKKDNIYALAQDPSEKVFLAFKNKMPPERSSSSQSIPAQIKELADLKDSGAITVEEFEAKKTELLAKM